ncbi:DUF3953 domain-containing protein [Bacillus sp. FJAT-27986]|uniref:DUF3953 domain-containing protein n=1 Tax=Bacillus sp. FJAT-27986 TaxID=1743146 RepID=UPI00080AD1DA|nr:DUF3953 domain-containing protein [Bacillus sp. FJAT-27986]OCA89911.1 hypothetical protein A8L44_02970 [Bacillus sp. FJAT-27986]
MLKILRYVFSTVVLIFVLYGFITRSFAYQPFMIFFLGLMMLIIGLEEYQKGRKLFSWVSLGGFLFAMYVAIEGFILN